ncbi:hypothetical protein GQ43DRAFT_463865 [Delitschia confertaspora ATCC 74209]|uniref:F-box domain-containing protein n=1 Tax=Delitschia confertaspora ATCC 74209 TaxID=1513339 RepID=A0A9P4JPA9_9PLEO|nr:hypothetical protein GQ43DRAFT_463865 [Delitschia confertaspora ATCC 74209]
MASTLRRSARIRARNFRYRPYFRFLDLPLEIRRMILNYLLDPRTCAHPTPWVGLLSVQNVPTEWTMSPALRYLYPIDLLLVNHQICTEFQDLILTSSPLNITVLGGPRRFHQYGVDPDYTDYQTRLKQWWVLNQTRRCEIYIRPWSEPSFAPSTISTSPENFFQHFKDVFAPKLETITLRVSFVYVCQPENPYQPEDPIAIPLFQNIGRILRLSELVPEVCCAYTYLKWHAQQGMWLPFNDEKALSPYVHHALRDGPRRDMYSGCAVQGAMKKAKALPDDAQGTDY